MPNISAAKNDGAYIFNDMLNRQKLCFSDTAPPWRIVSKGLNIEAVCKNKSCAAFEEKVWTVLKNKVDSRFGSINVIQRINSIACPICNQYTPEETAISIGFYDCRYAYDGQVIDETSGQQTRRSSEDYSKGKKQRAQIENGFVFFRGSGLQTYWKYLQVEVVELS